jgi:hypothetical protein
MRKTEGRKSRDTVPLKCAKSNCVYLCKDMLENPVDVSTGYFSQHFQYGIFLENKFPLLKCVSQIPEPLSCHLGK